MATSADADGPALLVHFTKPTAKNGETKLKLNQDVLNSLSKKVKDYPLCIVNIAGSARKGKSFFLGYVIRRLVGLESGTENWMGWKKDKKPLKSFLFRNGIERETEGIWIWCRPFIVKNEKGKRVAVLLVDTHGTNDDLTSSKDMSRTVGLSLLMSTVMIFNCFSDLQDDMINALSTYVEFGSLALSGEESEGPAFQKLVFLIRDWNCPSDKFPYGVEGGRALIKKKLKNRKGQSDEARHARESIISSFEEVGCFLLPHIGSKGLRENFKGSISELDEEFALKLEESINELISPSSLIVKKIGGNLVNFTTLTGLIKNYVKIFNSGEVPSAQSMRMYQATSELNNRNFVEKALDKYQGFMEEKMGENLYISKEELRSYHSKGKDEALGYFDKAKKLGTSKLISKFRTRLTADIEHEFEKIEKENKLNRLEAERELTEIINEMVEEHRSKFKTFLKRNKEEDDERKIRRAHKSIKSKMFDEFEMKEKPGDDTLYEEYLSKAGRMMDDNFKLQKDKHIERVEAKKRVEDAEEQANRIWDDHHVHNQSQVINIDIQSPTSEQQRGSVLGQAAQELIDIVVGGGIPPLLTLPGLLT